MRALIDKALGLAPDAQVSFAFQGGEPTLAGLDFFKSFVAYVEKNLESQSVSYAIQTNGIGLDDEWAQFFAEHHFLVGLSLDGPREIHDSLRPDATGASTHALIIKATKLLRRYQVPFNVLCVLTSKLARHPQSLYRFFQKEHLNYVQFIPCLASLGNKDDEFALTPQAFYSFYHSYFQLWMKDVARGHVSSVGLFDNVMDLTLGQFPQQCGMLGRCAPQFVVESNGDVYPCDFFALDEYVCGNIERDGLEDMANSQVMRDFLAEPRRNCTACKTCRFERVCHKNCKRMNSAYYDETYCGYQAFLEEAWLGLGQVARALATGSLSIQD